MFNKKIFTLLFLFVVPAIFGQQSITWQRMYDSPAHLDDYKVDICKTTNNNFYIIYTAIYSSNDAKTVVSKINSFGDTIWTEILDEKGLNSIAPSNDGGCVFVHGYFDGGVRIVKLDSTGTKLWVKYYGSGITDIYDIAKTSDGGYIICGRIALQSGYVMKIDSLGELKWQKTIVSTYKTWFYSCIETKDNNYIFAGFIRNDLNENHKGLTLKLDILGNIIWEKK